MDPSDPANVRVVARRARPSSSPKPFWRRIVPSFTTLILIAYFILGLLMNGDIKPLVKRGFFCNDSSINYPFKPDTVGMKMLFFISLIVPSVIINICDKKLRALLRRPQTQRKLNLRLRGRPRKVSDDACELVDDHDDEPAGASDPIKRRQLVKNGDDSDHEPMETELHGGSDDPDTDVDNKDPSDCATLFSRVPLVSDYEQEDTDSQHRAAAIEKFLRRNLTEAQFFLFSFATTMLITGVGKLTCGRLRPHFMQRCQPNIDCSVETDINRYIEEFSCTNDQLKSRDYSYITTSWPSGHASIMFFSMIYLIIYLESVIPTLVLLSPQRVRKRYNPLIMFAIYVLMIGLAGYIALTRVSDHHHHPLDVFSGSVLGFLSALGLTKVFDRQFLAWISVS